MHAIGALSVPLFQPIEGNSWEKVRRRAAYAALGVFNGTEENAEFLATVDGLVEGARDTPVMLICRNGGSVEETPGNPKMIFRSLDVILGCVGNGSFF